MFRLARSPPLAVTSQTSATFASALAARVAVVPVTPKSAASTFATSLLNVTRQVRMSELVGDEDGSQRSMDTTCSAVVCPTSMVIVSADSLSTAPSFTLNRKVAKSAPPSPTGGEYVRSPSASLAMLTVSGSLL